MLKRLGAFTLALLLTAIGLFVWYVFSFLYPFFGIEYGPTSLRVDGPPFAIAAVALAASINLIRRMRSLPVVLLFLGASALFIARLHDLALGLALDFQWDAARDLLFGYGCLETPLVATPVNVLRLLGLFIPLGFLCYATSLFETHLTRRCS